MTIRFTCQECSSTLEVGPEWAGHQITCGGCQSVITVPAPTSTADVEAPGPSAGVETALAEGVCPRCGKTKTFGPGKYRFPIPMGPGLGEGPLLDFVCTHCGYVESYLGKESLLTKVKARWPRAGRSGRLPFLEGAMRGGSCPKCGTNRVYSGEKVPDKNLWHELFFPNRRVFPNTLNIARGGYVLDNYVCSQCAYVERYVEPGELRSISKRWPATLKDRKTNFTGSSLRTRKCPKCGKGASHGDSRSGGGHFLYLTKPAPGSAHSKAPVHQCVCVSCGFLERYVPDAASRHKIRSKWPPVRLIH